MNINEADQMAAAARRVIDIITKEQWPVDIEAGIATDDYLNKLYTPEQVQLMTVAMEIAKRKKKENAKKLWAEAQALVKKEAKEYGIL